MSDLAPINATKLADTQFVVNKDDVICLSLPTDINTVAKVNMKISDKIFGYVGAILLDHSTCKDNKTYHYSYGEYCIQFRLSSKTPQIAYLFWIKRNFALNYGLLKYFPCWDVTPERDLTAVPKTKTLP